MVFDLLWFDGESLLALPYLERRKRLIQCFADLLGPTRSSSRRLDLTDVRVQPGLWWA